MPVPSTTIVDSIGHRVSAGRAMDGVGGVLHTAALHEPHVGSHARDALG